MGKITGNFIEVAIATTSLANLSDLLLLGCCPNKLDLLMLAFFRCYRYN